MKFTDASIETQNALFVATINEAINIYADDHGQKEGDRFAAQILKKLGLKEKEFMALFNPSDEVAKEIEAVTGISKGLFHIIRPMRSNPSVIETIMSNQCLEFKSHTKLATFAKKAGIVNTEMVARKNAITTRFIVAEATHRYNVSQGTDYGMTEPAKTSKG